MNQIGESTISKVIVFHFKMLGLWSPDKFSILYFVYSVLLHLIFSLIYVSCMLMNIAFITDIKETMHSLNMTLTCVALLFKTMNFMWYSRDMKDNLKIVNDFELQNDDEINLVADRLKSFFKLWLLYYVMINVTGGAAYVGALFTTPRQLPFRAWYPVDWRNDENGYWMAYSYQVLGMIMQANLNICIEIFPGFLMYMARVKMEILSLRLERKYKDVEEQRKSVDNLRDSIKLHQHIVM